MKRTINTTIVYYTANRENEEFEKKIMDKLVENSGGLPIISVSQKPINLGKNICVGPQEQSYANAAYQLQIGIEAAETEFILAAESDCLYPPEYFTFIPPLKDQIYRYTNLWILTEWIGKKFGVGFRKKAICEGAQMAGKDFWLAGLKRSRRYLGERWVNQEESRALLKPIFWKQWDKYRETYSWKTKKPVITCKSISGGVIKHCGTDLTVQPALELPYWGSAENLRRELFPDYMKYEKL